MSNTTLGVEFDAQKVDAIFAAFDHCHQPGAAVGIAIGGRPVYRKGFGLASMEVPVVLSPTLRMRIGSVTKHFTALVYLLLCEEGKAGLDDPVGHYLPEVHPVAHQVTLRQLMGNISGLRDVYDIALAFSGTERVVASEELLAMYRDIADVNAPPGTSWNYNNGGWLLLTAVIERITGQPLEDVLRERVFEPVGMYATLLRRSEAGYVPHSAAAHRMTADGEYEKSTFFGTAWVGAGGIFSTIDDMLRWLAHMNAPVVGSAATWQTLKTPLTLANGMSTGYGLGVITSRYRGVDMLWHSGGGMGATAQMVKVPAAQLDVVTLVNRSDVHAWLPAKQIIDACLTGLAPRPASASDPVVTGTFRSRTTDRVIQLFGQDGHQIVSIDGIDMPAEADEAGVLWPAGRFAYLKQGVTVSGDPAQPIALRLSDFGNVEELVAVPPAGAVEVGAIAGRYRSDTTGTEATIAQSHEGPQLVTVGRFGSVVYPLECLVEGVWRLQWKGQGYLGGGILVFDRPSGGFRFSRDRTWALPFRRVA